jgi:hypothetical protein
MPFSTYFEVPDAEVRTCFANAVTWSEHQQRQLTILHDQNTGIRIALRPRLCHLSKLTPEVYMTLIKPHSSFSSISQSPKLPESTPISFDKLPWNT